MAAHPPGLTLMTTDTAHGGHHHHNHGSPGEMISVEAHLADILSTVRRLTPIQLAISEAEGCVLAEDIAASRPLPPFDNSAMDGYAVIAADLAEASKDTPVTLRVSGEVAAGDTGAYAVTPAAACASPPGPSCPGAPTRWCRWKTPTAGWPRSRSRPR